MKIARPSVVIPFMATSDHKTPAAVVDLSWSLVSPRQRQLRSLFLSPDVQTQRHVRQMRVIVLGPRAARKSIEKLAFVVSEILIAEVPIEVPVYLDGQPGFRRLEIIRIRSDKRATEVCYDRSRAAGRYEAPGNRSSTGRTR